MQTSSPSCYHKSLHWNKADLSIVIYLFPYSKPVSAENMNWGCVLVGGFTALLSLWYVWKRSHGYIGPMVALDAKNEIVSGLIGLDKKFAEERIAMFA